MKKEPATVFYVAYDGFELVDLGGPDAVFTMANKLTGKQLYDSVLISSLGGNRRTNSGLEVATIAVDECNVEQQAIILAMGGEANAFSRACRDRILTDWLANVAKTARLAGSICTGSFILAASGLINGYDATTHWAECAALAKSYPETNVLTDSLYVHDRDRWTSAGGTAGVDMALAMVANDHGAPLSASIAKRLVVYSQRPGYQSQFSEVLSAQIAGSDEFSALIAWIGDNLANPFKVNDLAEKANMSIRTFHRKFTGATGLTPSKYIEIARMEQARQLLEAGMPPKAVGPHVGFSSLSGFRASYQNRFGISSNMQRLMHSRHV